MLPLQLSGKIRLGTLATKARYKSYEKFAKLYVCLLYIGIGE